MATLWRCRSVNKYFRSHSNAINISNEIRNTSIFSKKLFSTSNDSDDNPKSVEISLTNGQKVKFETGRYARFADGCATVQLGDTTIMATAVGKTKTSSPGGFAPLTVVYHQKAAALGRIPMNFLRREHGQTDGEVLTSRIIDRSIRPLFPERFNIETQIICNPIAIDGLNHADVLAINAASAALAVSDVPWNGPVAAVRMGLIKNDMIINPTKKELSQSKLNLMVTGCKNDLVIMLEGSANEIDINNFIRAIKIATKECQTLISAIEELQDLKGKPKREVPDVANPDELYNAIYTFSHAKIKEIFLNFNHDKISRDTALSNLRSEVVEKIKSDFGEEVFLKSHEIYSKISKEMFRELIFEKGTRCDGRGLENLRNISCQVDLYEPLHGSALFQRGQTQVLCTVALDSPNSAMKLDRISILTSGLKEKNFFLHYTFPPFATNEVGRTGMSGRREIGHGTLAERALQAVIPDDHPFTIRLTSEVLESNGSSSMATVCGGSLALMDAGVAIKRPVAGVAMGLITKYSDNKILDYRILTDLLGIEDYLGDMDFKVAGTSKGITAVQADIKISGLPSKLLVQVINQAEKAKQQILDKMNDTISEVRKSKKCWPVMEKIKIPPHKRFKLIGFGGSNIKRIELETGVELSEDSDNQFNIFAVNQDAMNEAKEQIEKVLTIDSEPILEFGGVYTAKIVEIKDSGVLVTLYPSMSPALIVNSQLDQKKIHHPSALNLEVGQEILVKYFGRDPVSGTMRLSRKILQGPASEVARNFNN